ncbi:MAG: hypothetical protein HC886_10835 [Leptolyngbyaceae cyanobacterium SM1_1_3]|nr:hypothetical protein [Leptolyngbyaceae cyanobacterium SM1_1_3]NJN02262.1 hypothetical protein [Leptolyngbyaceae cyanobacterium RM1_1_2]NJO08455.1 hypothetical protein [Leptolyngbyaceae cyanobacterium SL_1_1]
MRTQDSQSTDTQVPVYHPLFIVGFVVLQSFVVAAIPIVVGLRSPDIFSTAILPSEAALWLPAASESKAQGH